MLSALLDILKALSVIQWLMGYFRHTPLKDVGIAHEAQNDVDKLSNVDIVRELSEWRRD